MRCNRHLDTKAARTAFMHSYRDTTSGLRLRRGLARILVLEGRPRSAGVLR